MKVVYDAAVLVAADRDQRAAWLDHRRRLERGLTPVVAAPVVAQVSRSARQVSLRRFLDTCEVVDFAGRDAHEVGWLLGRSQTTDVVDAHLVVVAAKHDATVLTSDVRDIELLADHVEGDVAAEAF